MLKSRLGSFEGLRVADLFAGSGALGLEALSRGAASVTFVESDHSALTTIRQNVARFGAGDRCRLVEGSALRLPRAEGFDLIFADAPYAPGSGSAVAQSVAVSDWLADGGWFSIETGRDDAVDPGQLIVDVEREVGRARLTLLRHL